MLGSFSSLIYDTVKLDIKFNEIFTSSSSASSAAQRLPLFEADGAIGGRVIISLPDKNKLYHYGINVHLRQTLVFHYPAETEIELCSLTEEIVSEGYLNSDTEIPFAIDLPLRLAHHRRILEEKQKAASSSFSFNSLISSAVPFFGATSTATIATASGQSCGDVPTDGLLVGRDIETNVPSYSAFDISSSPKRRASIESNLCTDLHQWVESFEGNHFSIRHQLKVSLIRSWYTSPVEVVKPFRLYKLLRPSISQLQEPVTLVVPDCDGKCIVELPSRFIEVGGNISVTITVQNVKKPVTAIYLMLLKAEHVEDVTMDQVVLVHRVFGIGSATLLEDTPEDAIYFAGFRSRVDEGMDDARPNDPIMIGAQFEIDLCTDINVPMTTSSDDFDMAHFKASHGTTATVVVAAEDDASSGINLREPDALPSDGGFSASDGGGPQRLSLTKRHQLSGKRNHGHGEDSHSPAMDADRMESLFIPSFDSSAMGLRVSRLQNNSLADVKLSSDTLLFERGLPLMGKLVSDFNTPTPRLDSSTSPPLPSYSTLLPMSALAITKLNAQATSLNSSNIREEMLPGVGQMVAEPGTSEVNEFSLLRDRNMTNLTEASQDDISRSIASSGDVGDVSSPAVGSIVGSGDGTTTGTKQPDTPTQDSSYLTNTIAVRYYLRAVVQDAYDRICWNTTELVLYRKESPTSHMISNKV